MKLSRLFILAALPLSLSLVACEPVAKAHAAPIETPEADRTHHHPTARHTNVTESLWRAFSYARYNKQADVLIDSYTPVRYSHISLAMRMVYPGARPNVVGDNGATYFKINFPYFMDNAWHMVKFNLTIRDLN